VGPASAENVLEIIAVVLPIRASRAMIEDCIDAILMPVAVNQMKSYKIRGIANFLS
jgi:hypothetical protein